MYWVKEELKSQDMTQKKVYQEEIITEAEKPTLA